jgi:nitrite reductase/ring-hydroxylating ferredoxin subunit
MSLVDERSDAFRVSRRVYADRDVHAAELQQIFRRCWLFVAHESEIPEPGDYVTRVLGLDPVIVVRDEHGQVQVLLNTCRHRGVKLCRSAMGNASHFRCSYHGWTYANDGQLRGVTFQHEVYDSALDKSRLGLYRASRVGTAHGLVFATWDPEAPSLETWLGPLAYYLEAIFGKFDGGLQVMGPPVHTRMPCNWKAETENLSGDGYHTPITHQTAFTFGLFAKPDDLTEFGEVPSKKFPGRVVDCGNGHTIRIQHLPLRTDEPMFLGYPEELWAEIERNLSPGQVDIESRLSVTHGSVFPNLSFLENFKTGTDGPGSMCRYIRLTLKVPVAADRTELLWWHLVPADASDDWKAASQRAYARTNGPSGMFEVDDSENFIGMSEATRGVVAVDGVYNLIAGAHHPRADGLEWPGDVIDADRSEHTLRAWLRQWHELMEVGAAPFARHDEPSIETRVEVIGRAR